MSEEILKRLIAEALKPISDRANAVLSEMERINARAAALDADLAAEISSEKTFGLHAQAAPGLGGRPRNVFAERQAMEDEILRKKRRSH